MTSPETSSFRYRPLHGFTLVEVTLSVSIMAFAALSLAGLMPSNLSRLSSNIEKGRAQGISRSVLVEAGRMKFDELTSQATYERYFSYDGEPLGGKTTDVTYIARVRVDLDASGQQRRIAAPGSPSAPNSMATVNVDIYKAPGGTFLPSDRPIGSFSSLIACKDLSVLRK